MQKFIYFFLVQKHKELLILVNCDPFNTENVKMHKNKFQNIHEPVNSEQTEYGTTVSTVSDAGTRGAR